ncbi:hypothetical protein PInf_012968 [Phytophthora infestans]|nr:hypothetical protein PInf_012968 [Phytophthora infestans]
MFQDAVTANATGARGRAGERRLLPRCRCPGLSDTQWGDQVAPPEPLAGGGDSPLEGGESKPGENRNSDGEMDEMEGQASGGEAEEDVEAERPPETAGADDDDAAITSADPPVLYHARTMSRAERNKRFKKTKKGEDESQLVPDVYDPYQRTQESRLQVGCQD